MMKKSVYYPVMLVSLACKSHLKAINVFHGSTGQQNRLLTHVDGLCVSAGHRGGEHLLTVPWAGLFYEGLYLCHKTGVNTARTL